MKRILAVVLTGVAITATAGAVEFYEEVRVGYGNDYVVELGLRLTDFSPDLPISVKA